MKSRGQRNSAALCAAEMTVFSKLLGYTFQDEQLLRQALTHCSHSSKHNERLEFLGDGILNCVAAALLYKKYPDLSEGDLSRLRAALVKRDALFTMAEHLEMSRFIRVGSAEAHRKSNFQESILADAVEAVIGAVYLDACFEDASHLVTRLLLPLMQKVCVESTGRDAKTQLQEWLQARGMSLPRYDLLSTSGLAHEQTFVVSCSVVALKVCEQADAKTRRGAEQLAAEKVLILLSKR